VIEKKNEFILIKVGGFEEPDMLTVETKFYKHIISLFLLFFL